MNRNRIRKKRKMNFTILELLIVIAIIAILAALFLPALNAARGKGYAIQCLNHLRQIGIGAIQYAGDHNDFMPFPKLSTPTAFYTWNGQLIGSPQKKTYITMELLRCPLMEKRVMDGSDSWWFYNPHYGVNNGLYVSGESLKVGRLKSPAAKKFIAETWAHNGDGSQNREKGYYRWVRTGEAGNVNFGDVAGRHNSYANTLMLGGNAEAVRIPNPFLPHAAGSPFSSDPENDSSLDYRY